MRLEEEFPINNGTVRIQEPGTFKFIMSYYALKLMIFYSASQILYTSFTLGVYYIYAQINYLDEHDVNAFQILHNDDPFLLCTTMTNTGRSHTISKANTCYTGYLTIRPLTHFSFHSYRHS